MNYDEFPTAVLVDCLPENRPPYKDSGAWMILEDRTTDANIIIAQTPNQDLRLFLISYYEFLSEIEDMEDVHIDLACSNLI